MGVILREPQRQQQSHSVGTHGGMGAHGGMGGWAPNETSSIMSSRTLGPKPLRFLRTEPIELSGLLLRELLLRCAFGELLGVPLGGGLVPTLE